MLLSPRGPFAAIIDILIRLIQYTNTFLYILYTGDVGLGLLLDVCQYSLTLQHFALLYTVSEKIAYYYPM